MCEHNDGKTSNIPPHTSNLMRTPPRLSLYVHVPYGASAARDRPESGSRYAPEMSYKKVLRKTESSY